MAIPEDLNIIGSVLTVNSSGIDNIVAADLLLPPGKSIAELLYDQEKKYPIEKEESDTKEEDQ